MEKNPAIYATVPKPEVHKREIWDAPTLFHALEVCEDERLKLAINLSFACSMRIGEILGLTWDCVDITPESIRAKQGICLYQQGTAAGQQSGTLRFGKEGCAPDLSGYHRCKQDRSGSEKSPKRPPVPERYSCRRPLRRCWYSGNFPRTSQRTPSARNTRTTIWWWPTLWGTPIEHSRITSLVPGADRDQ